MYFMICNGIDRLQKNDEMDHKLLFVLCMLNLSLFVNLILRDKNMIMSDKIDAFRRSLRGLIGKNKKGFIVAK